MTLVSDSISISFALHKAINLVTTNCNNWLRNRIVNYAQGAAGQAEDLALNEEGKSVRFLD